MLRKITVRQFQEWRAYADLEPFDEERADLRAASIVQAIYNSPRKKKDRLKLQACILPFGDQSGTPDQQIAQTRRALEMLAAMYGPKAQRGKK